MLYKHKAGTAENSTVYCKVFYHLAEYRTPLHILATSFHALWAWRKIRTA